VPNTYGGLTTVDDGTLQLNKNAGIIAVPGSLTIGDTFPDTPITTDSDIVSVLANNQFGFPAGATVTINPDGELLLNGHNTSIPALVMTGGDISEGGAVLTLLGDVTATGFVDPFNAAAHQARIFGGTVALNVPAAGAPRIFTVNDSGVIGGNHYNFNDLALDSIVTDGVGAPRADLVKLGGGLMRLGANNTYTGRTLVEQGLLFVNTNGSLGTTDGTATSGTEVFSGASLLGIGGVTITGELLTLDGPGFPGVGTAPAEESLTAIFGGGTFRWNGNIVLNTSAGAPATLGADTFYDATQTLEVSGVISGGTGLGIAANGRVLFDGGAANTYAGATTVAAGATLELNKNLVAAPNNPLTAVPGAIVIDGVVQVDQGVFSGGANPGFEIGTVGTPQNVTIAGTGTGTSGILKIINGAQQGIAALDTTGGSIDLSSAIGDQLQLNGDVTAHASANTFTVLGNTATAAQFQLVGTRTFSVDVGTTGTGVDVDLNVGMSGGSLIKTGAGTLQYSGTAPNTYGNTTVQGGTLLLNKTGGFTVTAGAAIPAATTLTIGNAAAGIPGSVVVRETIAASNWQLGGITSGGASVVIFADGLLDINHNAANTRTDRIAGGVVSLSTSKLFLDGNVAGLAGPTSVINATTGTLDLDAGTRTFDEASGATMAISAIIANGATPTSLIKSDVGRLTLTGNNTYAGATVINGGILLVEGSQAQSVVNIVAPVGPATTATLGGNGTVGTVTATGTGDFVSPGDSPGILHVTGNTTLNSGSTYVVEITGANAGSGYDQLAVSSSVFLNTPTLSVSTSGAQALGTSFVIITAGNIPAGNIFDAPGGGALPDGATFVDTTGVTYRINYTSTQVILTLVSNPSVTNTTGTNFTGPTAFNEGTNSGNVVVATFTDTAGLPASSYSATIDWGDGTPPSTGTVTQTGPTTYSVSGNHTYAEGTTTGNPADPAHVGSYVITVTINKVNAASTTATGSADVNDLAVVATGGYTVNSQENVSTGPVTVATFTDPGGPEALTDYSASINWGDNTTSAGTISLSGTTFTVQGSHTYTSPGPFTITTTITHENTAPQTAISNANSADQNLVATGGFTFTAVEGQPSATQTVATFTDPGGAEAPSNYNAIINWGDNGPTSAGTITSNGSTFTVTGAHTYADEGNYTITVTVNENAPTTTTPQTVTSTATVSDLNVIATGGFPITATEGTVSAVQTVATFTDPGGVEALSSYSASINWGDGTAPSAGTISVAGTTFTVSGQHTYGEEGSFTVTVTIDHDTTTAQVVTDTATVADPNVAVTGGFSFASFEGTGSTTQAVAQFTDPGGAEPNSFDPTGTINSHYAATIDWGDGTPTTTGNITVSGGVFTVSGSHTYAEEGSSTITTTVSHEATTPQTATSTATVTDLNVVATGGYAITAVEGAASPSQTVAAFTDPGGVEALSNYSAVINWGDNTATTTGTIAVTGSTFTVSGSHTYAEEGSYTITVTISHEGAATQSQVVTSTATVSDPNVIATGGQTITAVEGTAAGSQTVATFTDPGGPEALGFYSASINWGDNTTDTVGTITLSGNTFSVAGAHTYGEEGTFTITVTINHESTTPQIVTSTATVSDQNVAATGGFTYTAVEGTAAPAQTVAVFTDPAGIEPNSFSPSGTLDNYYAASINWGDGATTNGTLSLSAGSVTVSGAHTYAEEGTFTITVTISHESSTPQVVTSTANVSDQAVVPTGGFTINAVEGSASTAQTVATFTDPAGPEVTGDYTATINWGDGSATDTGTITASGNTFTVSGSHAYAEEGTYTVTVTLTHDAAPTATAISTAVVSDPAVVVTPGSNVTSSEGSQTNSQVLATFTDPGGNEPVANYSAIINWGDGSPNTTGAITFANGVFSVTGSHPVGEEGTFPVTVSITHDSAPAGTATLTATVSDPSVIWTQVNPINATEGLPIGNFQVAGFIDPGGSEPNASDTPVGVSNHYSATVDWGDGTSTSNAVIATGPNGLITVTSNHTYAEPGKYQVVVTAHHESAPDTQIKTTATVGDANVAIGVLSAPNNIAAGAQFSGLVTTFTDANPSAKASDFVVGLYWGDNTMTLGSVLLLGNDAAGNSVFGVYASKVYQNAGHYTLLVGVYDIDGAFVTTGTPTGGVTIYTPNKQADLTAYNANLYYAYQQKQSYDQQYGTQHLGYQKFLSNYWQGQFDYYENLYKQRESQP
jgi:large repetitive protein